MSTAVAQAVQEFDAEQAARLADGRHEEVKAATREIDAGALIFRAHHLHHEVNGKALRAFGPGAWAEVRDP